MGVSRDRWEGDTLVVETTNFNGKNPFRGQSSQHLRVTEWWTRVADDRIRCRFTVEDKATWDRRPWTAEMQMQKSSGPLFEHACHEGNCGLYNTLAARVSKRSAPRRVRRWTLRGDEREYQRVRGAYPQLPLPLADNDRGFHAARQPVVGAVDL